MQVRRDEKSYRYGAPVAPPHVLPAPLAHALQPIVEAHSGRVWAYEALLRGTVEAGFDGIEAFFDAAHDGDRLVETELALFESAFATFRRLADHADCKLFLNMDGRILDDARFDPAAVAAIADRMGVARASVCLELSERHHSVGGPDAAGVVRGLRATGMRIALDDFGQGYSELKLLYDAVPDYVKIDRFFVSDIAASPRKRLFVSTVVSLAHVLGARVIAEGVETEEEFLACRQLGCDLVQGWFIARPMRTIADLPSRYPVPPASVPAERAGDGLAADAVAAVPAVPVETSVEQVLHRFRDHPDQSILPVVDAAGEPLGYVHERDFRAFAYASYGRDLLANRALGRPLRDFLVRAPVVEAGCAVEDLLAGLTQSECVETVLVTRGMRYVGMIGSATLLRIVNQKRLSAAEDLNPLTRLPGNASINAFVARGLEPSPATRAFCYFDFNHFKPYNDIYGYRHGDRAITLFADVLRRCFDRAEDFVAHIGGDDFFVGRTVSDLGRVEAAAARALATFRDEVIALYDPEHRQRGFLVAEDRNGVEQAYPLLTCSGAILVLPGGAPALGIDAFSKATADGKRRAKLAPGGLVTIRLA